MGELNLIKVLAKADITKNIDTKIRINNEFIFIFIFFLKILYFGILIYDYDILFDGIKKQ